MNNVRTRNDACRRRRDLDAEIAACAGALDPRMPDDANLLRDHAEPFARFGVDRTRLRASSTPSSITAFNANIRHLQNRHNPSTKH
ncbi:hypothetical protein [Burkholderia oklahomensis]|uniref:hypothetical protein n=1 Tax=Burkholderia oklahomensis TaxID=342113 RepID=UPI0012F49945|nr:hypothetical protein [Burkholderia oklahomensis]MBI0362373.1 hypothetical protein [Burkholderia oklahomensis]MDN7674840.1 hypothetical protein [Burkholderia oklahomensis]QPS39959.1 hypothetical protein I6G57_29655 [Burkholderia oklahomensis]